MDGVDSSDGLDVCAASDSTREVSLLAGVRTTASTSGRRLLGIPLVGQFGVRRLAPATVVLALVGAALCGCAPNHVPVAGPEAVASLLPPLPTQPSPRTMSAMARTAFSEVSPARARSESVPLSWGTPIAVYSRIRRTTESSGGAGVPVLDPTTCRFLVSLDTSKGPAGEFYMSSRAPYRALVSTGPEHVRYDRQQKTARLASEALAASGRVVAFEGVYDGVYGEDRLGNAVVVFSVVRSTGTLPNPGDSVRPAPPAAIENRVYSGTDARQMVLLLPGGDSGPPSWTPDPWGFQSR